MKKTLCALLLSLPMYCSASTVQQIYEKLVKASGVKHLAIYVVPDLKGRCSIACTNGKYIIVSSQALTYVHNEDELAGIIGHEMAHAKYKNEMQADVEGLMYAQKAGYDYCIAAQFLRGLVADPEHPSGEDRYKNTGCH